MAYSAFYSTSRPPPPQQRGHCARQAGLGRDPRAQPLWTIVFLVEQNARSTFVLDHYGYLIQNGESADAGAAAQLRESDLVRRAYLTA